MTEELEAGFSATMAAPPAAFAGCDVRETITLDGYKFILADGSWLLFRKSGTEPVVRVYGEAGSNERLTEIIAAGRAFVLGE